ncbi:hypothetical protein ACJA3G_35095, partial [Streptomyces sp. YS-3]
QTATAVRSSAYPFTLTWTSARNPASPGGSFPAQRSASSFPSAGSPRSGSASPLLLCSGGLAEPLRGEPALGKELAERWAGNEPPGLAGFLADVQVRVKGYADDRTAVAVWEA